MDVANAATSQDVAPAVFEGRRHAMYERICKCACVPLGDLHACELLEKVGVMLICWIQ